MTRSAVRRITFSDATSSGMRACSEVSAMNVCVCASKGCGGRPAPPGSDGSCRAPAHWLQPGSQSAPAHTQLPAALTSDPFVYRNGWKIDCCPRNTCLELEGLRPVGSPTLPCVVLLTASAQVEVTDEQKRQTSGPQHGEEVADPVHVGIDVGRTVADGDDGWAGGADLHRQHLTVRLELGSADSDGGAAVLYC
ncbi:hypothetical protein FJT64_022692 [Amphibalanus amphitrite]|uniref:Uncharacterized protein n=1 Tax=Amphibalanus amphitrite TaxID=1232801 RepID=A0A6A4WDI8_AMPAM|nr:hypothetical protein FJT64_022692 [Amphibalanus amphitrite]